jgi:hypothetical protein
MGCAASRVAPPVAGTIESAERPPPSAPAKSVEDVKPAAATTAAPAETAATAAPAAADDKLATATTTAAPAKAAEVAAAEKVAAPAAVEATHEPATEDKKDESEKPKVSAFDGNGGGAAFDGAAESPEKKEAPRKVDAFGGGDGGGGGDGEAAAETVAAAPEIDHQASGIDTAALQAFAASLAAHEQKTKTKTDGGGGKTKKAENRRHSMGIVFLASDHSKDIIKAPRMNDAKQRKVQPFEAEMKKKKRKSMADEMMPVAGNLATSLKAKKEESQKWRRSSMQNFPKIEEMADAVTEDEELDPSTFLTWTMLNNKNRRGSMA